MSHRVVIVQPYLAEYRVPLFGKITEILRGDGIDFRVAVGRATHGQAKRRDMNTGWEGLVTVPSVSLRLGGHEARYRRLGYWGRTASLVILEHASGAIEAYQWGLRRRPPIALWGHGRAFVTERNRLDSALEAIQLRGAQHYLAYTQQGADAVAAVGFPPERVTVFDNSTDTRTLHQLVEGVTESDVTGARRQLRLHDDRIILVLGSIDDSKRVDLALEVHRRLASIHRDVTLVFAGAGSMVPAIVAAGEMDSRIRWVGRKTGRELATLAATSEFILNPGRIGLVATDSFALGLPIVTTNWRYHAPEFHYLENEVNAIIVEDRLEDLVRAARRLLTDPEALRHLKRGCTEGVTRYSVENSAARIREGILKTLSV